MAIPIEIKDYLAKSCSTYWHKTHPIAFTAQEIAQMDHISGREMAKTVVLKASGRLIMAVLPADRVIDMNALRRQIGCKTLTLATESEFKERFTPCRPGAMPPFGRLFKLPIFCDRALAEQREIEFNAGTHMDTIRMAFTEFAQLETPVMADFSLNAAQNAAARAA
jgi:Ala-tRNA(Pro) deacylase